MIGIIKQSYQPNLLLNKYPNPVVAYGLRRLRRGYSGPAIKIRRSTDNSERDFGFTGNNLDVAAISNFLGNNTGYVSKWYDQSGNNNDLTPINSTLPTINVISKYCVSFPITFCGLNITKQHLIYNNLSKFVVAGLNNVNSYYAQIAMLESLPGNSQVASINGIDKELNLASYVNGSFSPRVPINPLPANFICASTFNGSVNNFYVNNQSISLNISANSFDFNSLTLGHSFQSSSAVFNGTISEMILYPTDLSTNANAIIGEMNKYWGVY